MDKETYDKVILLNKRLENLRGVNTDLDNWPTRLAIAYTYSSGKTEYFSDYSMRHIGSLLEKHYDMIREEIDNEIKDIEKQIEEL